MKKNGSRDRKRDRRDRSRDRRDRRREKDVDVKTDPGVKTDFDAGANGGAYVKAEKMDE